MVGVFRSATWLSWLLFKGNDIFITDSQIATVKQTDFSRTGTVIMIQPSNSRGFGVPSEFSGVEEDNWFHRTLLPAQSDVADLIWKIVSS